MIDTRLPHISIILPTRNEADNVPPLLAAIHRSLTNVNTGDYEILFIDDSTDRTPEVIQSYVSKDTCVNLYHRHEGERTGLATAFVLGFEKARGEYIVCMDSDLQHPPSVIPKLIAALKETQSDIAVASRYIPGGSAEGLHGFYRKAISLLTKYFTQFTLTPARKTSDPGSGFYAFKKEILSGITLAPIGFKILLEMLVRTGNRKVIDVPYNFLPRENDTSKATIKQGIDMLKHIFHLFWTVPHAGRMLRFSIVGIIGTVVNLLVLVTLHEGFGIKVALAGFIAIGVSIISNFVLNNWFTFTDIRSTTVREILTKLSTFVVFSGLTSTVNYTVFLFTVNNGLNYLVAAVLGISAGFFLNFLLSLELVWPVKSQQKLTTARGSITQSALIYGFVGLFASILLYQILFPDPLMALILTISILLTIQGLFSLFLMIYAWESPEHSEAFSSPKTFEAPRYSFTALVPARHEEAVLAQTIATINDINYPPELKQIIVVCRVDDVETISVVTNTIERIGNPNITLRIFDGFPINKPHGLNVTRSSIAHEITTIFDAEDEPSADIYNVINTLYVRTDADVIQSGVQLMNHDSNWYSLFNVLEYFFWFKSCLHFFSRVGLTPLGGNTVFFKTEWLEKVNGWDQDCLTEDADIGIRLSLAGAKIRVVYDPEHVTKEETPPTLYSFIKQRTRWNQGFIQILFKKDWLRLPTFKQRLLALYILAWPFAQSFLIVYTPIAFLIAIYVKMPTPLAILANLPLYVLGLFLVVYNIGIWEFTRAYNKPYKWYFPIISLIFFIPFQIVLGISAFRACYRTIYKQTAWEKTAHTNAHRTQTALT